MSWLGRYLLPLVPAAALLVCWQAAVWSVPRGDFTFGSPLGVLRELRALATDQDLAGHAVVTAAEAAMGLIAGTMIGTVLGLSMWFSKRLQQMSKPYLVALGAVPVFALGPVLVFWFGTGIWSKVVLAGLSTVVVAAAQSHSGTLEASPHLVALTRAFGGSKWTVFRAVVAPSATVWVLAALRINVGMALLGAFVGEFISSRRGLGHLILVAEGLYNVNQIWAGVLCIAGLALVFHAFTRPLVRWAERWKEGLGTHGA